MKILKKIFLISGMAISGAVAINVMAMGPSAVFAGGQ